MFRDGALELDLPRSLERAEAIAWNARFEQTNGLVVSGDGVVRYTGVLREKLHHVSPELSKGFHIGELESVHKDMMDLRARLCAQSAD